jgi:hypothetical protein
MEHQNFPNPFVQNMYAVQLPNSKTFSLHMNTLTQPSDFRAHASKQSGLAHYSTVITPPSNRRQIASCCSMELLEMQFPAH